MTDRRPHPDPDTASTMYAGTFAACVIVLISIITMEHSVMVAVESLYAMLSAICLANLFDRWFETGSVHVDYLILACLTSLTVSVCLVAYPQEPIDGLYIILAAVSGLVLSGIYLIFRSMAADASSRTASHRS